MEIFLVSKRAYLDRNRLGIGASWSQKTCSKGPSLSLTWHSLCFEFEANSFLAQGRQVPSLLLAARLLLRKSFSAHRICTAQPLWWATVASRCLAFWYRSPNESWCLFPRHTGSSLGIAFEKGKGSSLKRICSWKLPTAKGVLWVIRTCLLAFSRNQCLVKFQGHHCSERLH